MMMSKPLYTVSNSAVRYAKASVLALCVATNLATAAGAETFSDKIEGLIAERKFEQAIQQLNDRQNQNSNDVEVYRLLAKAYLETGAGIAAEAALERARRLGADYSATAVPFAKALLVQGRYSEALKALRGVTIPKEMREAAEIVVGDANFAEGRYNQAKQHYTEVLKGNNANPQAYLGLARLEMETGSLLRARDYVEKAYEVNPENTMVLYTRGLIAKYENDIETADSFFLKALKTYPDNLLVNLELAALRIGQGKLAEAENYLDAVYAVSAHHPMALYLSASILAIKGDYQAAESQLIHASAVTETYLPAMYIRGLVAYQLGNYAVAETTLKTVLRARPASTPTRLALANTYMHTSRPKEAYRLLAPLLDMPAADMKTIAVAAAAAMAAGYADEGTELYKRLAGMEGGQAVLNDMSAKLALSDFVEGNEEAAVSTLVKSMSNTELDLRNLGILGGMQLKTGDLEGADITINTILKAVPGRALGYNMRGTLEYHQGAYAKAVDSFSAALARNPDYFTARRNRALAAMQLGNYASAEKDLKRLLEQEPTDTRAKAALGRSLLRNGKPKEAVDYFRTVVSELPASIDVAADYAEALAGAGVTNQAIDQAKHAAVLGENRPDILKRMGLLLMDVGQPALAARPLSRYVAFDPENGEAHMLHGRALLKYGLYTGAKTSFRRAALAEKNRPSNDILAWYMFTADVYAGRYEAAKDQLPHINVTFRPKDVRPSTIGDFWLAYGDMAAAEKAYKTAFNAQATPSVVIGLSKALDAQNKEDEAVTILKNYLESQPDQRQVRMELGRKLERAGKIEEAADQYETILRTGVADAAMVAVLANAYLSLGNRKSIPLAQKAHLMEPDNPAILDAYGWIMLQAARNTREAMKALEKATRRSPSTALYKYHLGMVYLAKGDIVTARQLLGQALKLDPNFEGAKEAASQLERLER